LLWRKRRWMVQPSGRSDPNIFCQHTRPRHSDCYETSSAVLLKHYFSRDPKIEDILERHPKK
jgi:hypothetical protein